MIRPTTFKNRVLWEMCGGIRKQKVGGPEEIAWERYEGFVLTIEGAWCGQFAKWEEDVMKRASEIPATWWQAYQCIWETGSEKTSFYQHVDRRMILKGIWDVKIIDHLHRLYRDEWQGVQWITNREKNVEETGFGWCGSSSPAFTWGDTKERDTTRLGVGTGNWSLANTTQKILSTLQRRFGYIDGRTGLFELQLKTRAWLCALTEAETSACWSRGSVSQWHQPAFVKEYKFTSLPNTYSVFWTLSKASCAHSLPSQVLFFLQGLQITLATPVQEQQTVSRSSEPEQFNSQPTFIKVNNHVTLASTSLPTCYIRYVSHVVIVCVWVSESHNDHYGCNRLCDRCEGHPMVEGKCPYCRLLLQATASGYYCRLLLQALQATTAGHCFRLLQQATAAGYYCRLLLQATTAGHCFRLLLQATAAGYCCHISKAVLHIFYFHFIYLLVFHTFPTCRTNRRSLGILQRSSAL